jgi:RNA polymerase sigma-70 factor (ECF subfamily)
VEPDSELVIRLQAGDEQAFTSLVERYHPALVRLAMNFVPSRAVAEEVAQETWLGLVRGIHRFQGRSSLKTWLFRILVNRARTTGQHEARTYRPQPKDVPSVDPYRFGRDGTWSQPPAAWTDDVEDRLAAHEAVEHLRSMLDQLPDTQRQVVLMRDVEGLSAHDVCEVLDITEANQRVLLHRGRSRLRAMLEAEMGKI